MRAVHRPFAVLAVALLLAVPALAAVGGAAADSRGEGIELRIWQGVGSAERLRILAVSARPPGGPWSHATVLELDGLSASGRHRYADVEIAGVEARVWQAVDDARRVYVSARASGGSWRGFGTVRLDMRDINRTGTYRYHAVVLDAPASPPAPAAPGPCAEGTLSFGFYAYFEPVSASAGTGPDDPAFATHTGYEADLLTALEAMEGAGLSFARAPIEPWEGIWLRSAGEYDVVGGGITILDSRRRAAAGTELVRFTAGHIAFRQSLLVRADDAERLRTHDDLTRADRVGVLAATTGAARLLQLAGLADADGVLTAGARVVTPDGAITADGSDRWFITAAAASPEFAGRTSIEPPSDELPRVIYLGGEGGEAELLAALAAGDVDAIARGEIGNRDAARASGGAFAVTALDPAVEWGGFTIASERAELAECLNAHIDFLTNDRAIGYAEWSADPTVFQQRARLWNAERSGGGTVVAPCAERPLRLGFYAHFPPVSASADPDPDAPGFHVQTGYEADLMTALEAMEGAGVVFERRGIPVWEGLWLRAAGDEYDVIGGGITILDSRRRAASGAEVVTFTRGHIAFPQSLLARADDAARYAGGYASAGGGDRIGAFAGTTGETRLLPLVGLADAGGVLTAGARVVTPAGEFEADGSDRWFITAGGASPEFAGRTRLLPPSGDLPGIVYVTDDGGTPEDRLAELLRAGDIELASMSEVSSLGYARDSGGALAVVAVEEERPLGGLALAVGDAALARCLSDRIDDLTDERRIGFAQWADDPSVFMERARRWNAGR